MWPESTPILVPALAALTMRMRKEQACTLAHAFRGAFTARENLIEGLVLGFSAKTNTYTTMPVVARTGDSLLWLLQKTSEHFNRSESSFSNDQDERDTALIEATIKAARLTRFWCLIVERRGREVWPPGDFVVVAADEEAVAQVTEEGQHDLLCSVFRTCGIGLLRVRDENHTRWITRPRRRPRMDTDGTKLDGTWLDHYPEAREMKAQLNAAKQVRGRGRKGNTANDN